MGKSAPTAPDPVAVAAAQTQSNDQTAQFNQQLNMIDSYGPNGSVTYTADPSAPGGYSQNTTLSPSQQSLYDQSASAENQALGIAGQQIGRVGTALGQSLDPATLSSLQTSANGGAIQSSVAPTQASVVSSYGNGGPIQMQIDPSSMGSSAVQNAANAAYSQATSRLDPQWNQEQEQLQSQLTAQGLNSNDAAYQTAMTNFNNSKTDAYNQANYSAIAAGDAEQNTLYGQNLSSGQFANAAQSQANTQNLQAAAFNNSAQAQEYGQNLSSMTADNAAQAQAYGQSYQNASLYDTAQQQAFNQGSYAQELPLNEFSALLGLGQVSSPTGVAYTPSQAQSTNVAQIDQNSFQDQEANYQQQNALAGDTLGGLFSLGSSAISATNPLGGLLKLSDARAKVDIRQVGQTFAGLPIYAYRYRGSPTVEFGVIAQEVLLTQPHAVHANDDGLLRVNYGAIG